MALLLYKHLLFSQILSENKIGPDGAIAVCELLSKNKTIIHLNLSGIYVC